MDGEKWQLELKFHYHISTGPFMKQKQHQPDNAQPDLSLL